MDGHTEIQQATPPGGQPGAWTTAERLVLAVEGDTDYVQALREAWTQLGVRNGLRIVPGPDDALRILRTAAAAGNGSSQLAVVAVVLDPEMTGEQTGAFLREVRQICNGQSIPVIVWSNHASAYKILEGKGVAGAVPKPLLLPLIQELHSTSRLDVRPTPPFFNGDWLRPTPSTAKEESDQGTH